MQTSLSHFFCKNWPRVALPVKKCHQNLISNWFQVNPSGLQQILSKLQVNFSKFRLISRNLSRIFANFSKFSLLTTKSYPKGQPEGQKKPSDATSTFPEPPRTNSVKLQTKKNFFSLKISTKIVAKNSPVSLGWAWTGRRRRASPTPPWLCFSASECSPPVCFYAVRRWLRCDVVASPANRWEKLVFGVDRATVGFQAGKISK